MQNNIIKKIPFILGIILGSILDLSMYSSFGLGLFFHFAYNFFIDLGNKILIKEIFILIALIQWVIGPILSYAFVDEHDFYVMVITEDKYMSYVLPATFLFIVGLSLSKNKHRASEVFYLSKIKELIVKHKNIDLVLTLSGFLVIQLWRFAPDSLKYIIVLLGSLQYIGLLFIIANPYRKSKKIYITIIFLILFSSSLAVGMFHDFILWSFFILVFTAFIYKPTFKIKFLSMFILLFTVVAIQTIKHTYREGIGESFNENISTVGNLVSEKVVDKDFLLSDANISSMVTRINQGWIIARILSWTPRYEPFANGETIIEALQASFMPRFLFPYKVKAGGRTYFTRFTGKDISDNTSMGLSLLGESYANFGITGGAFFMFVIGFFYNYVIKFIYTIARKRPTLIFFLPLIFLQVVKAETDFSVIMNHLFKASITVALVFWSLKQFFNIRL